MPVKVGQRFSINLMFIIIYIIIIIILRTMFIVLSS